MSNDAKILIENQKSFYKKHIGKINPNKKTIDEVLSFIESKLDVEEIDDAEAKYVGMMNCKEYLKTLDCEIDEFDIHVYQVLPNEKGKPYYQNQQKSYLDKYESLLHWIPDLNKEDFIFDEIYNIIIFVDKVNNFISVEGSATLEDEIFLYHGLDEKEMENLFIANRYINLLIENKKLNNYFK